MLAQLILYVLFSQINVLELDFFEVLQYVLLGVNHRHPVSAWTLYVFS